MKLSIRLPEQIVTCHTLLPTFSKNGLKLENYQYISMDKNIINFKRLITLPWTLQLDLVNSSMNNTQKTRISFYRTIRQRIGTIKSQVYKNMKIFFNKELFSARNFCILIKINTSNGIRSSFSLLRFYFLHMKFFSCFNQNLSLF